MEEVMVMVVIMVGMLQIHVINMKKKEHKIYKNTMKNWKRLKVYLQKIKNENEAVVDKSSSNS